MWTLVVLCGLICSHGVQGWTISPGPTGDTTYMDGVTDSGAGSPCGGYLYSSSGTFYSPNYPNMYPPNENCIWYIRPGNRIVQLEFSLLDIEYHPNCNYDAIYVYDGSSTSSTLLGKVCDNSTNLTFNSTGSYLTVRFRSDGMTSYSGFQADYRVVGSCRYNCGSYVGSCSCYSDCGYRGNCCPDYQDYCYYYHSTPAAETSTAQPSCYYNCGWDMGSCSCSSSCEYYGNCCHDYYSYCPTTTTTVPFVTDQPSCRHNCGWDVGSCSCRSSCEYYGNCCHDYYSYCLLSTTTPGPPPTTANPIVTHDFSCQIQCGLDYAMCSCSWSCEYSGNCCHDYYYYCSSTTSFVTDQPSCRYNCGLDMGSCSCHSSCEYNGNCCHDYNSYCWSDTTVYPFVTDSNSCQNKCGWEFGSCSCSWSCESSGNCCYDYYSYCYVTTNEPATGAPCGGSLFGSGTFSSPNHPYYYHDNAYCVWQIRASFDQRIFLAFTYLQLENCCSCDYISVYDGPSVGSAYLGKVCNNSQATFYSTSNYMTVVFRTDGSVVGRGFNAEFMSSLSPSSGQVDCSSDNMSIVIERSYLNSLGYGGHSLYLNDPNCRPQVSSYQVVFSFPINTCGNVREFHNGRVVYTNAVRAYTSDYGEITRQSHFKLNVSCRMEQDSVSQIMYVVQHHNSSSITGTGRFNTSMDFYTSSSFYYKVTQVPYQVTLNQNLYIQVDLRRGDNTLVLYLDTCVTSPSPHDFHTRSHYLVRNGCPADQTYSAYSSGTRAYARFRFKAFQFLRATDSVYIQCKVLICPASDTNSRCRQTCRTRKARNLASEHESQTLVLGPIQLKADSEKEEGAQKQDEA